VPGRCFGWPLVIGGVPVLKVEGKNGATYWADQGKFALSAGERSVMEQILGRLNGKSPTTASLAQSSAYQEAQHLLVRGDARLLEYVYSELVGEHEPISGFRPVPARSIENLVKAVFNLPRKADRPVARDRPRRGCPDQDRG